MHPPVEHFIPRAREQYLKIFWITAEDLLVASSKDIFDVVAKVFQLQCSDFLQPLVSWPRVRRDLEDLLPHVLVASILEVLFLFVTS